MNILSKLIKVVKTAVNPPKVVPIPRPNPAPQVPLVPTRVAAPTRAPAPRVNAAAIGAAVGRAAVSSPPVRPVVPWFANEGPRLQSMSHTLQSAIADIDAAVADSNVLAGSVWWKGNDADQFRDQIRSQHHRLLDIRTQLVRSVAAVESAAMQEQQRYNLQERGW